MAKVLIVLTSHTTLGSTGRATGYYFDEMATPYWALKDVGHEVDIATIAGGPARHDPGSVSSDRAKQPTAVRRFLNDPEAMAHLADTPAVVKLDARAYDGIFLPGGHGTMWDFGTSEALGKLVGAVYDDGGIIGAVCHGPAGLVNALRADGQPLVSGLKVNSFTDAEERAVGLAEAVPFLLETRLRELGGAFEGAPNFTEKAVRDGRLVTGQNPMSAQAAAMLFIDALVERRRRAA